MNRPPTIRFDSSGNDEAARQWSQWLGPARALLRCNATTGPTTLYRAGGPGRTWGDPLEALTWMEGTLAGSDPGTRWAGYLSYDLGRLFEERLPASAEGNGARFPLFEFTLHDPRGADGIVLPCDPPPPRADAPLWNFSRGAYLAAVRRVLDYIAAGDVFQVNLSQRCTLGMREPPAAVYERLRSRSPAAYGALLDYGDHALICNSPELFLKVTPRPDGRRDVVTRPIKGTRPRAPGMETELLHSAKDQAELNMIVDLERNDLGRVCEVGTVRVRAARAIEAHPTVYHGVATIEGVLRPDVSFVDLLRATFPGGSVTGAPKVRAMQIVDELEPVPRGPYCGAIGYLGADGTYQFNVAIRTMLLTPDGLIHVPVGGGIVADSDPAEEYEETLVKAAAMLEALR